MPAKVSLLIPAYNRAAFVAAAVGSVLRQSYREFELLVWDDGSIDATADVADRAAAGDPRVKIVRAAHAGLCPSINAAAKMLDGKYFGWVDSDDAIAPTALAETVQFLDSNPDVGMVYTDYLAMDESGRIGPLGNRTKIPYSRDRLLIDFMTFHFRLMRRAAFDHAGGIDENAAGAEDYDLCLRLSEQTEIRKLARPLYFYRVHDKSVSREQRLWQITQSQQAIARALVRRGMDKDFDIDVELVGRFRLRRKNAEVKPQMNADERR
jgi:glycosyltransferase involved in cell wall biosynthesis